MTELPIKAQDALATTLLNIAAKEGFASPNSAKIARQAKLPLSTIQTIATSPEGFVGFIADFVNRQVSKRSKNLSSSDSFAERLFEICMIRFEFLEENRTAFLAIGESIRRSPQLTKQLIRAHTRSHKTSLNLASKSGRAPSGNLFSLGFKIAFMMALDTWRRENDQRIEKTMTTLDRALSKLFSHFPEISG